MSASRRFHAAELGLPNSELRLGTEIVHHLRVLRLTVGEKITLFDGKGHEAEATILSLDEQTALCRLDGIREMPALGTLGLIQSLPKGSKLDSIIRMATEVGATEIRLAIARRSIARPEEERATAKTERLIRIAEEAARQCGRPDVPKIQAPRALGDVCRDVSPEARRLILAPTARERIDAALSAWAGPTWIAIGPEGGWDENELASLESEGWVSVSLPTHVLRVETAAPVALALARSALEGWAERV